VAGISGSAEIDVRDAAAVRRAVAAARPDVVLHTAYRLDDPSVNVEGTRAVATVAVAAGARLVHISSDVVFPGTGTRALTEDDEPRAVTPYGESKLAAERACPPEALIVRTSLIFGGSQPAPQERMALDAADGVRDMAFFTDEVRCPIQVGDLAAALLELTVADYAGLLHVAGADRVSRHEFAELLTGGPVRAASLADATEARPRDCSLSVARAEALLRTPLRGVRAVLKDP
jgi:dTDP-4-dehydrorhamnose reductase